MTSPDLPPLAERPGLAVDVVAFALTDAGPGRRLEVLLGRRAVEPAAGQWALPGTFVLPGEALEAAARRVLAELSGLVPGYLEQLYTFADPGRDRRGRVVSVVHLALVDGAAPLPAGPFTVAWRPALEPPELAFDHAHILAYAVRRLRAKLGYTHLAVRLLPETFTLSELQAAHEAILGRVLDKRNFRKSLEPERYQATSGYRGGAGRPARLYRFVPDRLEDLGTP